MFFNKWQSFNKISEITEGVIEFLRAEKLKLAFKAFTQSALKLNSCSSYNLRDSSNSPSYNIKGILKNNKTDNSLEVDFTFTLHLK